MTDRRPIEELCRLLADQVSLVGTSALAYDRGNLAEAARIATAMRVLFHDTEKSHSVVGQLGIKDRVWISDTSFLPFVVRGMSPVQALGMINGVVVSSSALVMLGPGHHVPFCSQGYDTRRAPQRPIAHWWNAIVFRDPGQELAVRRRDLVLDFANREGGAHVDRRQSRPWFKALDRENFEGWERVHGGHPIRPDEGVRVPFTGGVARASMRQMADEVLTTFGRVAYAIRHEGGTDPEAWGILRDVPAGVVGDVDNRD